MKFRVEGLAVEIDVPENLHVKKPKLGALIEWHCSCGFEKLKIEQEDIASTSGNESYRNLWPILKDAAGLTRKWNQIHREAKSFVDYFEKLYAFKGEYNTTWTRIRQRGFTTTISIRCSTCERQYPFGVKVNNSEQPETELTPLGAYRKFGIRNKKVERVLARWIAEREGKPYKTPSEYLKQLLGLEPSIKYVRKLINKLNETIKENPPKTRNGEHWVADLTQSLVELQKDFEEITKKQLEKELIHIEDLIPKPKEYRFAMISSSAENLLPLSIEELQRK